MGICQKCGREHDESEECRDNPVEQQPIARKTSRFAVASFILSFLSPLLGVGLGVGKNMDLGLLIYLVAIIFGIIGLVQTGKHNLRGRSLAKCGIVIPIILPAFIIFFSPFHSHEKAREASCMSNQRQIALAIIMHCEEKKVMPGKACITQFSSEIDKQQWRRDTDIHERIFNCPSKKLSGAPGPATAEYAMNADIMGMKLDNIPVPAATLLTADTVGVDAIFNTRPINLRHYGRFSASFVDGHVEHLSPKHLLGDPEIGIVGPGATAASFTTATKGSVNKIIIQGATNVIEMEEKKHGTLGIIHLKGKELRSTFGSNSGIFVTAYLPYDFTGEVKVADLVNGASNDYNGIPPPPAAMAPFTISGVITLPKNSKGGVYTFMLPPAIGKNSANAALNNGYIMTEEDGRVTIEAAVLK